MRALIYARVSSDPKGRGRSVDQQIAEGKEWAGREGWDVVDIVRDDNRSASRHAKRERAGWQFVRRQLEAGGVDVLVTWEASRAQRDLDAYVDLRQLCARSGVRWAYSGAVYDLSDRSDRFRTGLDALVAEDEADRTRERVLRAMRTNALHGRPHGRRLYGYRRVYDSTTGELVGQEPEPAEAVVVREAARRFLAGESARSIANDFNQREIPTPAAGEWDLTRVRRILTNPAYNAKRVHRGEVVGPATWPPILDDQTFSSLRARYEDPARRTTRQQPTARLLTGAARCGVCGGPMVYAKQGGCGNRTARLTYACRKHFCTARDLHQLDTFVTDVVLERLSRPDARQAIAGAAPDPAVNNALAEAVALRARLDEAVAAFTAGNLSAATLGRIESDLFSQISEAERQARVAGLPTAAADVALADDPATAWERLTGEQRRAVVRGLMQVVVLPVKTRGRRTFDPTCVRIEWKR